MRRTLPLPESATLRSALIGCTLIGLSAVNAGSVEARSGLVSPGNPGGPASDPALEDPIQEAVERQIPDTLSFMNSFAEAYRRYPAIPDGILEAMAFVGTRWTHRMPESPVAGHHNMPQTYGVMGLYRGVGGFADGVAEAANALGVSQERVLRDSRINILATAALLDRSLADAGIDHPLLEELGPVLGGISGIPADTNVGIFARNAYVYDLFLALDRGHDDFGIRVPEREIAWDLVFEPDTLAMMQAPMVRIISDLDRIEAAGLVIDPSSDHIARMTNDAVTPNATQPASTDYPPALWVASPNYSSRNGSAITHVAIHTVQGSYSGCISWFQNPSSDVSAHYVERSSDGQVTQMVREKDKAWHIGSENPYTLGTEHEGYVEEGYKWYTTAMYNSSAALTKDMCSSNKIDCNTTYPGPATSYVNVVSNSYHIKGHQHYQNQTHTDPGQYWDWSKYKSLTATSSGGGGDGGGSTTTTTVLDSFEASEGHFNTSPTYSGSTEGISSSSTAERTTGTKKNGSYSEQIKLMDNTSTSANWEVRFLSGSGSPSSNVSLTRAGGKIGFWIYSGGSGLYAGLTVDDGSAMEFSTQKTIPVNSWTYLEWKLDDSAQWDASWSGDGDIDASSVTLDAIWFYRVQTSYTVYLYIDDVTYKKSS